MKNLARVLSLVLVLTMMVSSVAFAGTFTDIEAGSAYAEATAILSDLGIIKGYEDGSFGPDKVITRAEVVAIVNRMQGLSDAAKAAGGTTAYTDVPADEWYAGDVNLATQMGIISGDGNGLFRPDDQVKYEEAVKMMVAACGYTQSYALSRGGWPTGYLVIASEQGITKGMTATAGAPAFRGIVAKLAYQALTAPMMVLKTYDTTGISNYAPDKTKILVEEKLGVKKLTGFVYANSVSAFDGSETEEGKVNFEMTAEKIGAYDAKFEFAVQPKILGLLTGATGVEDTLGLATDIYVKENADGKYEVVAYTVQAAKNNVVTIENTGDIKAFTNAGKNSFWTADAKYLSVYNEDTDSTNTTYALDDNAKIILNGKNIGLVSANLTNYINTFANSAATTASATELGYVFAPTTGKVELIDKENDGKFDYIKVTSYETTVLEDAPYANNTKIATKAGTIDLDFAKIKNAAYSIKLDGEEIAIADLKKGDVISVAKTDKYHWDILVSRETVTGQVSECDKTGAVKDYIFVVDGKSLVHANLAVLADANLSAVNAGDQGTFYLDAFGNVAFFDAEASASKDYGFIVAAGKYNSIGETDYEVRILDKTGATNTYVLAENVRYGVAGSAAVSTPAATVYSWIESLRLYTSTEQSDSTAVWTLKAGNTYYAANDAVVTDLAGNYASRIITFTANSAGKITAITTAKADPTAADDKNFALVGTRTGLVYNAKTASFAGSNFGVAEDTVVFNLPITATSTKDDYAVSTVAALEDDGAYNASIFSVNEEGNIGMLVITNDPQIVGADQHLAVALKAMTANNAEGDRVLNVTFLQNGEEKTLATTADLYSAVNFEKGDLFEYSVNAAGEIDKVAFAGVANADLGHAYILSNAAVTKDGSFTDGINGSQYVFGAVYAKNATARIINLKQYNAAGTNAGYGVAGNIYRHVVPENVNIVVIDCAKRNTASDKVVVGAFGDIQASKFVYNAEVGYETADEGRDYAVLIKYFKDAIVDIIVYKNFAASNR